MVSSPRAVGAGDLSPSICGRQSASVPRAAAARTAAWHPSSVSNFFIMAWGSAGCPVSANNTRMYPAVYIFKTACGRRRVDTVIGEAITTARVKQPKMVLTIFCFINHLMISAIRERPQRVTAVNYTVQCEWLRRVGHVAALDHCPQRPDSTEPPPRVAHSPRACSSRNSCTSSNNCMRFFSQKTKWVPSPIVTERLEDTLTSSENKPCAISASDS